MRVTVGFSIMAATSGDLIHAVADCFGIPEETIKSYYRSLREAGFVTKSGRGTGAAKMTSRDAAVLLVAAIGGGRFDKSSAVDIVKAYGELRFSSGARRFRKPDAKGSLNVIGSFEDNLEGTWRFEGFDIPQLQDLKPAHSLIDGLSGLIDAVRAGAFTNAFLPKMKNHARSPSFEIEASAGRPFASFSISLESSQWDYPWFYEEEACFGGPSPEPKKEGFRTDLIDKRGFSHRTIFRLADLLND